MKEFLGAAAASLCFSCCKSVQWLGLALALRALEGGRSAVRAGYTATIRTRAAAVGCRLFSTEGTAMARGVRWSFLPAELEVGDLAQLSLDDLYSGLPADSHVVGLIIESRTFPLVPVGRPMPTLDRRDADFEDFRGRP